jgi:tetratricopeptide (TPR) repeat protein
MAISWIHLTDWHIGQSGEKERFPNLEDIFFNDLRITLEKHGGLDLVFFTGDFVNIGKKEEYDELEKRLVRFWEEFRKHGNDPKLIPIPGNHDLIRPSEFSPVGIALGSWDQNRRLQTAFWEEEAKEIRQGVIECFAAYSGWLKNTAIPLLDTHPGILPGDQLGTFTNGEIKLSLLGLNTTYLQHKKGDFEGKLWVSPRQIPELPKGNYLDVLRASDISVLLTHQPESWLSPSSKASFRSDIARSGVFDLHFCGHLHQPMALSVSEGGSEHRHTVQGASFFGLEQYGEDDSKRERIHGYTFGIWDKIGDEIHEKRWPRIAAKKQDGGWGLVSDPSSYLTPEGYSERTWISRRISYAESNSEETPSKTVFNPSGFFEDVPTERTTSFPKLQFAPEPQHQAIRAEERHKFLALLQNAPVIGIVTDWGMGANEFIATAIFGNDSPPALVETAKKDRILVLNCDAFENAEDFEVGFKQQFGITLHQFAQSTTDQKWTCLLLDGVQQIALEGASGERFRAILDVLSDYSRDLKILVTGRTEIGGGIPSINLSNLDLPETRAYLEAHPKSRSDLLAIESVERINFASGGLTVQIDILLSRLEIASLDAVLEEHLTIEEGTPLHKTLLSCIRRLGLDSSDDTSKRSLELLRALSILPYGATIELIKRFNPKRPFYPAHAEELRRLTLIDAIPLHYDVDGLSGDPTKISSSAVSPKILRVPKQVRDCVISDMKVADRKLYAELAAEFIFGDKWKNGGKIKLRKLPFEYQNYLGRGLGNEYSVLHSLLTSSIDENHTAGIKRVLKLTLHYCGVLRSAERYKDLKMMIGSILHLIDSMDFDNERVQLHRFCGRACRLSGFYEEAIRHLEAARALWPSTKKDEHYGRMLIELSISYRAADKHDEAKSTAEAALAHAKSGSLLESQAKNQLAYYEDGVTQKKLLIDLEQTARKNTGWQSHANDIAIVLTTWAKDQEKLNLFDRVLQSEDKGRNRYRAIVGKGKLLMKMGKIDKISLADEICLNQAYQYYHSQRLSEFAECHEVIWTLLEKRGRLDALLSLFRHSSFIWRLEGKNDLELKYFKRLTALQSLDDLKSNSTFLVEISYLMKRAKVLILRIVPSSNPATS